MRRQDIAIIGMACAFPGARNLREFWANILNSVDSVTDAPEDWEADRFFGDASETGDKTYCKRGGFLREIAQFDPVQHGIMPGAVDGTEPDHFLALATASDALADARVKDLETLRERTAVIVGRGTYVNRGNATAVQHSLTLDSVIGVLKQLHPEYEDADLHEIRRRLKQSLPAFDAGTAPGLVPNIISGRIANRLNLMGPNYIVDAACASSLIAIDLAARDLISGRCDMAIAGGVHASTPPVIMIIFSQLNALSRKGAIRPFDAGADGTLLGEGAGMVVLKRAEDAEREGDRIYALLKGIGSSSDGRALGLLAPRVEGEELALRRAYDEAGVEPGSVALLEAHGTATEAGDVAEIKALSRVFGGRTGAMPAVALGSVKSMIGHTMPASGMAGLIKGALSLHHKVLPPTIHCEHPNPKLELESSTFYLNSATRPWIHGSSANPRRAGVNAFGFGGVNAHAVLEEYTGPNPALGLQHTWPHELFILSAGSLAEIGRQARRLEEQITGELEGACLKDLAWSVNRKPLGEARLAIIASSTTDLRAKLGRVIERANKPNTRRIRETQGIYFFAQPLAAHGKVAFLYPGEGAQYPNMLADLCIHFPVVRAWFDRMDRAFEGHSRGLLPSQVIFPPPGLAADGRLFEMDAGAEAVFCANQALDALIESFGITPDAVAGHSTGEHTALLRSGVVPAATEAELLEHIRGVNAVFEQLNAESLIVDGVLATVAGASRREMDRLLEENRDRIHLALDNCPNQVVLCGKASDLDPLLEVFSSRGAICQKLAISRAYHTPGFEVFTERIRRYFDSTPVQNPRIPVWSCASAERFPDDPDGCRSLASAQWAKTVRFRETVEAMHREGARIFVEVGPRGNLTSFVNDILRDKEHTAIAANLQARDGLLQWLHMLGELVAQGVNVNLEPLFEHREPRDAFAGNAEIPAFPMKIRSGLQPMRLPSDFQIGSNPPVAAPSPDQRTSVMLAQLNTMSQFLAAQQQVFGAYFQAKTGGSSPAKISVTESSLPPFIDSIVERQSDRVVAYHRFDLSREKLFVDHTLGRHVSESDPALTGLPVVPLTVTMEIMAEGGSLLMPGMFLTGMRDVRAYRWITLEKPGTAIEISARLTAKSGEAHVEVREYIKDEGQERKVQPLLAEGIMQFQVQRRNPVRASPFSLKYARPSHWTPERLYLDGMFHGPSLRGTRSMDRVSSDGAVATLMVPDRTGLIEGCPAPAFLLDPVMLDNAGQAVAFWSQDQLLPEGDIFPYGLAALECFTPPQPSATVLECRIRATYLSEDEIHSDIEIVDASGNLHCRLSKWGDRRFTLPRSFWKLRLNPLEAWVSTPWNAPIEMFEEVACRRVDDLSFEWLQSSHGIWLKVLAHAVLSRRERVLWESMAAEPKRKIEWLLGRCAAKDAVRDLLLKHHKLALCPADVEIEANGQARPVVNGRWKERLGIDPVVSIAHSKGCSVALAALSESHRAGTDLKSQPRPAASFAPETFTADERALLENLSESIVGEWTGLAWCSKEAVAKELGHQEVRFDNDAPGREQDLACLKSMCSEFGFIISPRAADPTS